MADEGPWNLTPAASVEDAVRGMDIVVSSIPQGSDRPLKAEWWTEGMLAIPLDVLTAWEDDAFEAIDMLVADNDAGLRAAAAQRRPDLRLPDEFASFGDIVLGNIPGRLGDKDRIMAIPTGLGSVDMPLAWSIYRAPGRPGSERRRTCCPERRFGRRRGAAMDGLVIRRTFERCGVDVINPWEHSS